MSTLNKFAPNAEVESSEADVLGGFEPKASGCYDAVIAMAYLKKSSSSSAEAISITLRLDDDKQTEITEDIWYTNGKGEPFYIDKKTSKKMTLPGMNQLNGLAVLSTGKELATMGTVEKVVNIFDYAARKDVPTKCQVIEDLIDAPISVGLLNKVVDVTAKDNSGKYVPTGKTRKQNAISKFFKQSNGLTLTEVKAGKTDPEFKKSWEERFNDKVIDESTATASPTPGAGAAAPNSLFDTKPGT